MNSTTRRDFARCVALAGAGMLGRERAVASPNRPALCLFSKHLPKLNYAELAHTMQPEYEPADESALSRDFAFLRKQVDAAYGDVS